MRISAGKFKSRTIEMPKGIRPTSLKVRESLFEILKQVTEGAEVLDLYCGSGAVGIEAFSRGAKKVTFVDNNLQCIKTVKKNVAGLGISDISSIEIYKRDALRAIEDFCSNHQRFDIVFLDPPYYKEIAKNTLIALSEYDILVRNALIVAEVFKKDELPERCAGFKKARSYRYGDTILVFFTPYLTRPVQ